MKRLITFLSIISATLLIVSTSCNKNKDTTLPPIGGYNTSNDVAAANSVEHWTFEGTANATLSGTAPTTSVGATYTTGVKGQALTLTNGYILYPVISKFSSASAISSVSVSAWIKIENNGTNPTSILALTQAAATQTDWNTGPVNFYVETGRPVTSNDTLVLHSSFSTYIGGVRLGGDNINDYGVRGTDFQTLKTGGTWVHYVMRYDATTSNIDLFANGVRVSNNNFRHRTNGTADMGPIITTPPIQAVIGSFPNASSGFAKSPTQSWHKFMTGSVDELRVYSKSLTDDEITALYQLEKAGR